MCVSTRERNQFPSVLLHTPPLASEFGAGYDPQGVVLSSCNGAASLVRIPFEPLE